MLTILAALAGAVLGLWLGESAGLLWGAGLGWLIASSFRTTRETAALRESLRALEARLSRTEERADQISVLTTVPAATAPPVRERPAAPPTAPVAAPSPPPLPVPARTAPPVRHIETPPVAPSIPSLESAPGQEIAGPLRWLLGSGAIAKFGIGLLFIGLAYLASYVSGRVTIPIAVRLGTIGGAALVLLGLGWRLRGRRPGYAQVLQGGAVAVLYLTLFVAFRAYGLLDVAPAFVLMVLVAALAAALAVLQDAAALAVIGALGGFATPLLVSTGSGNHVALFAYYLVIDLGIAAVAWHKTWRALNVVGFVATFLVGTAWGVLQYRISHYASSQAFLIAFFLVYAAIMLMPARRRDPSVTPDADTWVNGTLLFGLPTITFALQYGLVRDTQFGAAISALVLAAFYVAMASAMRGRPRLALAFEGSLAIGTVFVTLTIPFALDARSTAGAWALEGAGLVWLGFRRHRPLARLLGYGLLVLAGATLTVNWETSETAIFGANALNALLLAAASLVAAWSVQAWAKPDAASSRPDPGLDRAAEPALVAWATLWLVVVTRVEVNAFVSEAYRLSAWLLGVSSIALLYTALASALRWRLIAWPTRVHAPLLALGVLASLAMQGRPSEGGGWWAWPLALATHLVVLARAVPRWPQGSSEPAHALGVLVLAALGALEGRAITAGWGEATSAWSWLGWLAVPAVLLFLLPSPAASRVWPVSLAPRSYRRDAASLLAFGLLGWTIIANIGSDGTAAPLPHVPLLNPLDLGVAVVLTASWRWRLRGVDDEPAAPVSTIVLTCLSGAGFVWLNAIVVRAFHHYRGVPFHVADWMASFAVQTGITLLWSVTALVVMWLSARHARRAPWLAGAALLAAVVVKLMVIDLSGSGTVARIVSFMGVGIVMLVIAYVAPLPGRGDRHEAQ